MISSTTLEWIVALLVCWTCLTAIYRSSAAPVTCGPRYAASMTSQSLPVPPPDLDAEAVVRDMMLHD
ncbi:hypothetical protein AS156_30195 [Bradyrhizobium macuxiense]|uniref:Uncharacterized protein n=1 Tax=Bradyrhizobium macuxiense TaxID=1755647 RepID=A0A109K3U4_9BRAD|nr:hypothetical protein [Bradyrhizobium macuxiense]KWV60208.1 hypothetical protein AS156_30195 [Bradyrhizobium macuxiense]